MSTRNIIYGNTAFSLQNYIISTPHCELSLSRSEMIIFHHLLKNKRSTVNRKHLSSVLDSNKQNLSTRFVDVHVSAIRKKLLHIHSNLVIETAWGRGYRLVAKDDSLNDGI